MQKGHVQPNEPEDDGALDTDKVAQATAAPVPQATLTVANSSITDGAALTATAAQQDPSIQLPFMMVDDYATQQSQYGGPLAGGENAQ